MIKKEPDLSLKRSQHTGVWICLGALTLGGVFLAGVFQQSYWALAIPVALGVLAVLNLAFWIGFTINTIDVLPSEADQYRGAGPRYIAMGICVVSILLGAFFLVAVFQGSYLALAIPVSIAVLSLLGMIYWIGWSIATQKSTLAEKPVEQPEEAQSSAGS